MSKSVTFEQYYCCKMTKKKTKNILALRVSITFATIQIISNTY